MADSDDQPIDISAYQLRRNAIRTHLPRPPAPRRLLNLLDFSTNNVAEFFSPSLPRGPRRMSQGEVWFSTTAINGTASYLASTAFLTWGVCLLAPVPMPRPELSLIVFDRNRVRTAPRSTLALV